MFGSGFSCVYAYGDWPSCRWIVVAQAVRILVAGASRTVVPRRGRTDAQAGLHPRGESPTGAPERRRGRACSNGAPDFLAMLEPTLDLSKLVGLERESMQVGLGTLQTMRPEATATPGDSILTDGGHLLILLWAVVLSSCRVRSYADPGLLRVSPRCRRPTGWSRPRPRDVGMVVMPERRLALGRYEVTVGEYRAFAAATAGGAGGGCDASLFVTPDSWRDPGHPQTDRHPRDPPQLGRRSGVRILAEPRDGRGASLAERKRSGHGRLPGLSPAATSTERTREARAWSAPTAPSRPACRTWCRMSLSGHRIAGRATAGAVCSAATLGAAVPVSRAPTRATAPPPLVAGPLPAFVSRGYWIDSCNADRWWFLNDAFATVNGRPPYSTHPRRQACRPNARAGPQAGPPAVHLDSWRWLRLPQRKRHGSSRGRGCSH